MMPTPQSPLTVLEVLRKSKQAFQDELCRASQDQSPLQLQKLRSENIFVLAEFLFLLRAFDLAAHPDRFESYVQIHNQQLRDLIDNPDQRRLMGLEVPRLQRGLFTDVQMIKAKANLTSPLAGLDQADMQRLTIMLFSPETGRRMLELLDTAGFLTRTATPFQSMVVTSTGFVEACFTRYLDAVQTRLATGDAS